MGGHSRYRCRAIQAAVSGADPRSAVEPKQRECDAQLRRSDVYPQEHPRRSRGDREVFSGASRARDLSRRVCPRSLGATDFTRHRDRRVRSHTRARYDLYERPRSVFRRTHVLCDRKPRLDAWRVSRRRPAVEVQDPVSAAALDIPHQGGQRGLWFL